MILRHKEYNGIKKNLTYVKCAITSVNDLRRRRNTEVSVEVEYCIEWVYDGSDPYDVFHQHARIYECGSRRSLKIDVKDAKRALAAEKAIAYAAYAIRAESALGTLISELIACGVESLDPEAEEGCSDAAWAEYDRTSIELVDALVDQQAEAIVTCNTLIEIAISEHRGCDLE